MTASRRFLYASSAMICLSLLFTNCTGGFKVSDEVVSQNPWSQGSADTNTPQSDGSGTPSCSVTSSSSTIAKDEQFALNISSSNILKIELSVNHGDYISLGITNGTLSWPGGSFESGNYELQFRALAENGSYLDCDPANQTIRIYTPAQSIPTLPPIPTTPSTGDSGSPNNGNGGSSANIDRNYIPLTGYTGNGSAMDSSFKNFKTIYHPDNLPLIDISAEFAPGVKCYNLTIRHHQNSLRMASSTQKYRIFIPPGTKFFDMMTLTYWDQTTRQAIAVKMDSPPQSSYEDVLNRSNLPADSSRILEAILNGQEIRAHVNEGGNVLPRISGGTTYGGASPYIYQTNRGGWLYVNQVKLIGDVAMNLEIRMCVDPTAYKAWYNSASWDNEGNPLF